MRATITKSCEWCGVEFTGEKRRMGQNRFCGGQCAALWREQNRPGSYRNRLKKKCVWCGVEIPPDRDRRTWFCSHSCGSKSMMSDPEFVRSLQTERKRQICREVVHRPDVMAKRIAETERRRAMGFPGLTYRNGMVTVPQQTLFDALPGAVMEYPIYSGAVGTPPRVDLAIPSLRLAIEVDGSSHHAQWRKEIDAKKEQILKERGWTLLRFSNNEVLRSLSWVVGKIQATIGRLQNA